MASTCAADSPDRQAFGQQDFISFDFDSGDDERCDEFRAEAGSSSRSYEPFRPAGKGVKVDHAACVSNTSIDSRGKKRKYTRNLAKDRASDGMTKKELERAAALGTPWFLDVNWNTAKNAAQQLNQELIAYEAWLSPTKKEHECRQMVIKLIRSSITAQWRDAKVHSFGIQDTQLYLPQGDIDVVVVSNSIDTQRREAVLRSMAACLRRNNLATDVKVIAKAKVPIIKFVCTYGKYRCDISVNQTNGLLAADYVNQMQHKMPAIRPLVLITKHHLQQRGMSEVYTGGLGSFSVILLIINFLQIHPKVQRGEIDPCRNLGVLFLDFLELYGKNFGYDNTGVRVQAGGGYFSKAHRGWVDPGKPYKLAIEDPQSAENDISKGSYNILSVRSALSGAFDLLTSAVCQRGQDLSREHLQRAKGCHLRFDAGKERDASDHEDEDARRELLAGSSAAVKKDAQSLLGSIVGVSRELMKSRRDVANLYDSGVLQAKLGRTPPAQSPSPGPSSYARRPLMSRLEARAMQPPPPSSRFSPPPPQRVGRDSSGVRKVVGVEDRTFQPKQGILQRSSGAKDTRSEPFLLMESSDRDSNSRYAQYVKRGGRAAVQGRDEPRGRDPIAVPRRYVSEESDEDEDEDEEGAGEESGSLEEGEVARTAAVHARRQRQRTRDYWLSKSMSSRDDETDRC